MAVGGAGHLKGGGWGQDGWQVLASARWGGVLGEVGWQKSGGRRWSQHTGAVLRVVRLHKKRERVGEEVVVG